MLAHGADGFLVFFDHVLDLRDLVNARTADAFAEVGEAPVQAEYDFRSAFLVAAQSLERLDGPSHQLYVRRGTFGVHDEGNRR